MYLYYINWREIMPSFYFNFKLAADHLIKRLLVRSSVIFLVFWITSFKSHILHTKPFSGDTARPYCNHPLSLSEFCSKKCKYKIIKEICKSWICNETYLVSQYVSELATSGEFRRDQVAIMVTLHLFLFSCCNKKSS